MSCRPLPVSSDWQPISSAPKDGTPIMLFGPHGKIGFGLIEPVKCDDIEFFNSPAAWIGVDRWAEGRSVVSMGGYNASEATHWQPLPAPPVTGA